MDGPCGEEMLNLVGLVEHGLGVDVAESEWTGMLTRHGSAVAGQLYYVEWCWVVGHEEDMSQERMLG